MLGFMLGFAAISYTQDSLQGRVLKNITIGVNKWEQPLNEVPNKITRFNKTEVWHNNPQTSADLLSQTGTVFVQKSQLGGGSPMIRGFATNRVLIMVDGVRMNNAIYRSGNLQNVISVDALSIESGEVIFGPGSLIYGSDAIGGVMDFRTLEARFTNGNKMLLNGSALTRYSTANNEKTFHADMNAASGKWSVLASFTYSDFDDLKMGRHGVKDGYLRTEYVERINNIDSVVINKDPGIQRYTGYEQTNFLGKLRYRPNEKLDLQYSFTYSNTGNAPRYDRLIQYRNGRLRFAEWYYGPMLWKVHQARAVFNSKTLLWNKIKFMAAYQDYKESRNDRARGSNTRTTQAEEVDVAGINLDATKLLGRGELFYGFEFIYNKVGSTGTTSDILNGHQMPFASRYPDGSSLSSSGIYASYKINLDSKFTFISGLRYSYNTLHATFDHNFLSFPYESASLKHGAPTGNLGLVFKPSFGWQLNATVSSGYRMPNIDDMGKLFESTPGNITVPNPGLQPEYAWNFETGVVKSIKNKLDVEVTGFYTILKDAIVRRPATFNNQDSINFGGMMSRVESLQNVAEAEVYGLQAGATFYFTNNVYIQTNVNWITGKETDDEKNEQVPLRHAPPFYGSTHLHFRKKNIHLELFSFYNSEISNDELAPSEQAKKDIYARDRSGLPYSPGWYTLNFKSSYQASRHILLSAGWENITNRMYRPYSSGIVAPGSNLIFSLRASF